MRSPLSSLLAVLAVAAAACGGRGAVGPSADGPGTAGATAAARLEALYRARADSALLRFTQADVEFMTGMIGHHAQALEMAGLAPSRDASPTLRTLAARIKSAQQDEIDRMRGWLSARGIPAPEVMTMNGHVMTHGAGHSMPGMLTAEQMAQLDAARGPDFDRLFLKFMIQHHRGAVTMVAGLLATHGAAREPVVFKLASDIHADQVTEIARMERLLVTLP
ncbi:MAG: DUF305 domain-containing protein [Gemmatimonadetes bacterium]|nr:DUF305 domain-containing protein [Gemmatimonadota bacterium]